MLHPSSDSEVASTTYFGVILAIHHPPPMLPMTCQLALSHMFALVLPKMEVFTPRGPVFQPVTIPATGCIILERMDAGDSGFIGKHFSVLAMGEGERVEPPAYAVERITGVRGKAGQEEYEVKWCGYRKETWEPRGNLDGCEERINAFMEIMDKRKKSKKRTKRKRKKASECSDSDSGDEDYQHGS